MKNAHLTLLLLLLSSLLILACTTESNNSEDVADDQTSDTSTSDVTENDTSTSEVTENDTNTSETTETEMDCDGMCDKLVELQCDNGPDDIADCLEGCATIAQSECNVHLESFMECIDSPEDLICDSDGDISASGCEGQFDAIDDCMENMEPINCDTMCTAIMDLECEGGPGEMESCMEGCVMARDGMCADKYDEVASSIDSLDDLICDDGELSIDGTEAMGELNDCLNIEFFCEYNCDFVIAADCLDGPPDMDSCKEGCVMTMEYCGMEQQIVVNCAGNPPVYTCDGDGNITADGCDTEFADLYTCISSD